MSAQSCQIAARCRDIAHGAVGMEIAVSLWGEGGGEKKRDAQWWCEIAFYLHCLKYVSPQSLTRTLPLYT